MVIDAVEMDAVDKGESTGWIVKKLESSLKELQYLEDIEAKVS